MLPLLFPYDIFKYVPGLWQVSPVHVHWQEEPDQLESPLVLNLIVLHLIILRGNIWPLGPFNCTLHFQWLPLRVCMHSGADASNSALALCQEQMYSSCFQSLQYLNKKPHPWIATPAATAASPSLCIALSSPFILFRPKLQHFLLFRCCAYYILIASFVLCEFKHTLLFVQCRF